MSDNYEKFEAINDPSDAIEVECDQIKIKNNKDVYYDANVNYSAVCVHPARFKLIEE